ncbi:MAG TPA: hypothetical protein VG476_04220 [Acidimicrobiales bacterium]|nr:hypothetical protein [Acidimicrobiales bacterium]
MSAQRTSFGKLERDRAKKARAAAKRERRQGRGSEPSSAPSTVEPGSDDSTSEVLERLAAVHEQYDAGRISYEELEEQKAELLGRLEIN